MTELIIRIFNNPFNMRKTIIITLITFTILIINCHLPQNIAIVVNVLFPLFEMMILKFCFPQMKFHSLVLIYLFIYFINAIITTCIMATINYIVGSIIINDSTIVELCILALVASICIIVSHTKQRRKIRTLLSIMPLKVKVFIDSLLILCFLLAILVVNEPFFTNDNWSKSVRIILLFIILMMTLLIPMLVIYSVNEKFNEKINKLFREQINSESIFYTQLAESMFELRQFKHNYKNTNIALMKLLSEGKNKEALKLLEAQNQDLDSTSVQFDTGNGIVDALLTDKQRQADNINTTITFEGAVPGDSIEAVDLCIIFGNPLDNAIEACVKIDAETPKEIHISCACNSGFIFIDITNPVKNKVEIRGNLPETTKPDKEMHGFGLYSLEKVIKKYDGEVTCECDEKTFKLSIEFSIPVKDF